MSTVIEEPGDTARCLWYLFEGQEGKDLDHAAGFQRVTLASKLEEQEQHQVGRLKAGPFEVGSSSTRELKSRHAGLEAAGGAVQLFNGHVGLAKGFSGLVRGLAELYEGFTDL